MNKEKIDLKIKCFWCRSSKGFYSIVDKDQGRVYVCSKCGNSLGIDDDYKINKIQLLKWKNN